MSTKNKAKYLSCDVTLPAAVPGVFENDWSRNYKLLDEIEQFSFREEQLNLKLKAVSYLEDGDGILGICGDELRERAWAVGANLGQGDGERLLRIQEQIPVEIKRFHIPLTGTLYKHRVSGNLYFPMLVSNGQRWSGIELRLVISVWGNKGRFLIVRETSQKDIIPRDSFLWSR